MMRRFINLIESAEDYRGQHQPANHDGGAPIFDLTAEGIYPEDIYGPQGREYALDAGEAFGICMRYKGRPNAQIRIVPAELVRPKIAPGDWIAITRAYARDHGKSHLNSAFKIISKVVCARDVFTDGNSLEEWGYDPQPPVSYADEDKIRASLGMRTKTELRAARQNKITESVHDIDPVAEALPYTMVLCGAQGYRKGWDGESDVGDDSEFRQWCEQRVKDAYAEIAQYIRGDAIRIFRAITLPEGETPDPRRYPGVCWTYREDALHPAHGTLRDQIWVFTAETTTDQIDWVVTLAQNASPGYEQEKEIRLIDFGHVEILDISATGEVK